MKKKIIRVSVALAVFIAALVLRPLVSPAASTAMFALAYLIAGYRVLYSAGRNILRGRVFDENFLMSIASLGAFAVGEYPEGAAVMIFFQVGELFESYAVMRSRKSISALMEIRPDRAFVLRGNEVAEVDPDEVAVGESILVRPGEKVPLDGIVEEGASSLDCSALTGESLPRDAVAGDEILSGSVNLTSLLRIRTTRAFHDSTVSRILELVENASAKKSRSESFISRFAAVYTPFVVISALLLAVVPSLITGDWSVWVYRALNFLVVSCPCALVISVPLSFFGGIGGASRKGVLIKGGSDLENLAKTEIIAFDKTGTLTEGVFEVKNVIPCGIEKDALLELAAYAEYHSSHPAARAIKTAYGKNVDADRIGAVREIPGFGVEAVVDSEKICVGNARLMESLGISVPDAGGGSIVHAAKGNEYLGCIEISDRIKPDSLDAVKALRGAGVRKIVMLSGDRKAAAETVGEVLGLDGVYAELLPLDKVETVEKLEGELSAKGKLLFVGDGINDAPVLARADVGAAMGALGSDAAIESADVVIMNDKPSSLAFAMQTARKTLRIVRENIILALAVKFLILILCAFGVVGMWAAVFADVGVMILAVLNALRCL